MWSLPPLARPEVQTWEFKDGFRQQPELDSRHIKIDKSLGEKGRRDMSASGAIVRDAQRALKEPREYCASRLGRMLYDVGRYDLAD